MDRCIPTSPTRTNKAEDRIVVVLVECRNRKDGSERKEAKIKRQEGNEMKEWKNGWKIKDGRNL
jgi:hypothetical protein